MKCIEIFEKRNLVATPKASLLKYKGQPGVFVHFTNLEKIGVNPQSDYKTPIGIYAYPIDYVLEKNYIRHLPFAGDRKFLYVLKAQNPPLDLQKIDDLQFKKFFKELKKLYPQKVKILIANRWENYALVDTPGGLLWSLLYQVSAGNPATWNKIMRQLGINGVLDNGDGIIHVNEPTQAMFTSIQDLKILEVVTGNEGGGSPFMLEYMASRNPEQFYDSFIGDRTVKQFFSYMGALFGYDEIDTEYPVSKMLPYLSKRNPEFLQQIATFFYDQGYRSDNSNKKYLPYLSIEEQKQIITKDPNVMKDIQPQSEELQLAFVELLNSIANDSFETKPEGDYDHTSYPKAAKKIYLHMMTFIHNATPRVKAAMKTLSNNFE